MYGGAFMTFILLKSCIIKWGDFGQHKTLAQITNIYIFTIECTFVHRQDLFLHPQQEDNIAFSISLIFQQFVEICV